jgi:hypothetical protein
MNTQWNALGPSAFVRVVNAENDTVARLYRDDVPDWRTNEANARLIAAAPELLAALRRAVPWLGKMIADGAHLNSVLPRDCEMALRQAEAIIAKAEGKAQ